MTRALVDILIAASRETWKLPHLAQATSTFLTHRDPVKEEISSIVSSCYVWAYLLHNNR